MSLYDRKEMIEDEIAIVEDKLKFWQHNSLFEDPDREALEKKKAELEQELRDVNELIQEEEEYE